MQIDTHHKRQQAAHPDLTLTGMYNVLAKLRNGEPLTAKDKTIHETGLIAVLEAYGWPDLLPSPASGRGSALPLSGAGGEGSINTDTLLDRLVALNAERCREEATGHIRWLRPDFQNSTATHHHPNPPLVGEGATLLPLQGGGREGDGSLPAEKRPWPPTQPEQVRAIADALTPAPQDELTLAARFTGKGQGEKRLPEILAMLAALGHAKQSDGG